MNTQDMQLSEIHDEAEALAHHIATAAEGARGEALSQLRVAAALALSQVDTLEHAGRSSIPAPLARHG
jgi:hypothetical protein